MSKPLDWQLDDTLKSTIQERLQSFSWQPASVAGLRGAAVAIVLTNTPETGSEASVLLTRRPAKLHQHSGQYALPGGKIDRGESVYDAARRELAEELGVNLGVEAILGRLDDYPTRSGFKITPVIFWAGHDVELKPSADEVDAVFHIPFSELDSVALPVLEQGVERDRPILCSEFPTLGHRMYAPTAAILYQFREVVLRAQPTRVDHFDQPRFAWK